VSEKRDGDVAAGRPAITPEPTTADGNVAVPIASAVTRRFNWRARVRPRAASQALTA